MKSLNSIQESVNDILCDDDPQDAEFRQDFNRTINCAISVLRNLDISIKYVAMDGGGAGYLKNIKDLLG